MFNKPQEELSISELSDLEKQGRPKIVGRVQRPASRVQPRDAGSRVLNREEVQDCLSDAVSFSNQAWTVPQEKLSR